VKKGSLALALLCTFSLGRTARAEAPCGGPSHIAELLMGLFPPASAEVRAESARALGACKLPGTAGALASAMSHDPELPVQMEAASALGAIGNGVSLEALQKTLAPVYTLALRRHTMRLLVKMGDLRTVRAIVVWPGAEDELRADALVALMAAGDQPPEEALRIAVDSAGPALGAAIETVRRQRALAKAPAAADPAPAPAPIPPSLTPASAFEAEPTTAAPSPAIVSERVPPPPAPSGPPDGTPLAITTSIIAGSVWGGGLSLLAQQDSPGVVMLVGTAGAVIGGGTAWGLTRFGVRPSPDQALWFTNATGWGTLAGLMAWAGSGSQSLKLKYGLLVGGETVGVAAGIWGARSFHWTPQQLVLANSLVVAGGVGLIGLERWRNPTFPLTVSPAAGYGTAPLMLVSAFAARALEPTTNDVHLAVMGGLGAAWTTGLIAAGAAGEPLTDDRHGQGGLLAGLGLGYLTATAAGAFTEVPAGRTYAGMAGMLAGNVFGLGVGMLADPAHDERWKLGAGLGGAGLGAAAFAGYYHLAPGLRAPSMTTTGALYGVVPWTVALAAASTGQPADARVRGGQLALGTAGAITGYLASRQFQPDAVDQGTAMATTALGMSAGAGIAKLTTDQKGTPEFVGVMGGATVGLVGGALFTHHDRLRGPDLGAGVAGAGYGLLLGTLAPTLGDFAWEDGRRTAGGSWFGLSAGALAGATLSHTLQAEGAQVGVATTAGLFGLGTGVGVGLLWPSDGSRSARIGAVTGPVALAGAGLLAEPWLRVEDGLGPSAPWLATSGMLAGAGYGWLVSTVVAPDATEPLAARQRWGGTLAGASAGMAAGLVLSKRLQPTGMDYLTTFGTGGLGTSLGAGLARLAFPADPDDRRGPALALGGASLGLVGGALVARAAPLRGPDVGAGFVGMGYGALLGTLAPSLDERTWEGDRSAGGGAQVGLALGGLGAAAAAHLTEASGAQVAVVAGGSGIGALAGLGLGQMLPDPSSQPARIGTFAGTLSFAALAAALDRPLRLHDGFDPPAAGLAVTGAAIGVAEGLLLAGAIDASGVVGETPARQRSGGALFGAAVGVTSGLVLSKLGSPSPGDDAVAAGGAVLGGMLGRGLAVMTTERDGRPQTVATMAGSLGGLGAAAALEHSSPLTGTDALAMPVGLGYGALMGALVPSLGEPRARWGRTEDGAVMAGLGAGGLAAVALRHATDAPASTVGWATLGSADGLLTGVGVGLLLDAPDGTRARRVGAVAGATAGLGIGALLWPRVTLDADDRLALSAAIAIGGWTGVWAPALGHADVEQVRGETRVGGLLAGAGATSFLAMALVPPLHLEPDLVADAVVMDALFAGAGAGAGALASARADAPVWGLLGAGTAGLVLGGALHRRIEIDAADAPLLALASIEGAWYGGWLPHLVRPSVTSRQQAGGLAAGALGAAGLAVAVTPVLSLEDRQAGFMGVGSAIGASVAGGSALLSSWDDQARAGLVLGGTTVGLVGSAVLAPRLELREGAGWFGAGGAALGATEGLVFAWAGRGTTGDDYTGALLVGAGVGTTLGLAGAAYPSFTLQRGLASAGYAAWGAWIGSFSGALLNRDPHEVTLGGLAGANAGFLVGYGLLRAEVVEPRDFGWVSLAGALGTVAGGGVGAVLSSKSNPKPILAGLAVGPAVGMAGGALILPMLRKLTDRPSARVSRPSAVARRSERDVPAETGTSLTSAEVLADKRPSLLRRAAHRLDQLVGVASWTPMVGSLPPPPGSNEPPPFIIGATGTLR
jgi:hypothetical protein